MVVRKVKDFTSSNSISVITELSSSGTYSGSSVDCGEKTTIRTAGYLQVAAEEANLRYDVEVFAEEEEEERDQEDQHEHQRRIFIWVLLPVSTNTLLFGHVHHHGGGQNAVDHVAEAQALARE